MSRPSWDEYFMEISILASKRSTCLRRRIGALIVRDKRILSTGYNGPPSGLAHCEEVGCLRDEMRIPSGERQELCRGLHAEQNAIIQASLLGVSIRDSILYCTHQPCILCAKMIVNAGIKKVIFGGDYPDKLAKKMLAEGKVKLRRIARNVPEGK